MHLCVRACVRVRVRVLVRACVRVRECTCVRACMCAYVCLLASLFSVRGVHACARACNHEYVCAFVIELGIHSWHLARAYVRSACKSHAGSKTAIEYNAIIHTAMMQPLVSHLRVQACRSTVCLVVATDVYCMILRSICATRHSLFVRLCMCVR